MIHLKEQYSKTIVPALQKDLGLKNVWQLPRVTKVVINVGLGAGLKDPKFIEVVEDTLLRITGQKPLKTLSRQSISNFKIRQGQVIGMKVTLRGARMYDFLTKLIHVALPRIRDFRGIGEKSVDQNGNLHLGFREHISFPEIKVDEIEKIHGLEVSVITNAHDHAKGFKLFTYMGFPFQTK